MLCEDYEPATENEVEKNADLDRTIRTDAPIDYFTIDIGLFPDDRRFDAHDDELQDLLPAGPERLRAFAVTQLRSMQENGHTYCSLRQLVDEASRHPLFYRSQFAVSREQVLADETLAHFRKRLFIAEVDGEHFFYLAETKQAEEHVERYVGHLLTLPDREYDLTRVPAYLVKEADALGKRIPNFESETFATERSALIEGVFKRRLFLITGRPGSGKTRALRDIMKRLIADGRKVTVLAPTGKATLRVREDAPKQAEVVTIDRWINKASLRPYLDDLSKLGAMGQSDHYEPVQNLFIDEMSMVDLGKLAVVFRALEVHEPNIDRVVLVGDENQLPPIGMGRPLQDILDYLHRDEQRAKRHVVRLRTNCRQTQDPVVVEAAHLFAGKNRYHTDLYQQLLDGRVQSEYLRVVYWQSPAELNARINERLDAVLNLQPGASESERQTAFNKLFGLRENGFVKDMRENDLLVDAWQLLTPYRGSFGGTLMLNGYIRGRYRTIDELSQDRGFWHSDKIIRMTNYYQFNYEKKRRELKLSNGSIGFICDNQSGWLAYFTETGGPLRWSKLDPEDFEAAYAITVHKSQGSEFANVFVIVPERRALLSRELVYTAMTRSTGPLTLFVQRTSKTNPLEIARQRSDLLRRNSSLLSRPLDAQRAFEPEKGVFVKSKIEYLIYELLRQQRDLGMLVFQYEKPPLTLTLDGKPTDIHPDFTITIGPRTYYWEHLGMLDRQEYYGDWRKRRAAYEAAGLKESLVTTDDLHGIHHERLVKLIDDLLNQSLEATPASEFSLHHYVL